MTLEQRVRRELPLLIDMSLRDLTVDYVADAWGVDETTLRQTIHELPVLTIRLHGGEPERVRIGIRDGSCRSCGHALTSVLVMEDPDG